MLLACFASTIGGARVLFPQTAPATALDPSQLIHFLNQTISWYRQLAVERGIATESDDQLIVHDNRQVADQAVRLAFDFARAQAETLTKQAASGQMPGASAPAGRYQALRRMEEKIDRQYQDAQAELESDTQKLAAATGRRRQELESQILELQSELKLAAVRKDAVRGMMEFVTGTSVNGVGASGLRAQVEELYREMERTIVSVSSDALQPRIRLRATSSAVEVVLRFPVDLRQGAEIDERVSHALVKALESESRLGVVGSDTPEIHLRTDLSARDATD